MKKALNIIKKILVWAVIVFAICMVIFTIVSVTTFDRTDRSLFGYKAFIIMSDSMSATDFKAGDLILAKEVDPATLQAGDIITFQSTNPASYGAIVTHKIRALTTDAPGNPGFITYGTTNGVDDEGIVTYSFVLGKYAAKIPGIGSFFLFLKTPTGYILCIFLPLLILILLQVFNSVKLFRRYKREQLAEMEAERQKQKSELETERKRLEEERAQSQKMMEELLSLKAQLAEKDGSKKIDNGQDASPSSEDPEE